MTFKSDLFSTLSILILCCVYVSVITPANGFYHYKKPSIPPVGDNGDPLFLTPLIEKGEINKARRQAKVEPIVGHVNSYSGFFTVNKTYNSNHFFWFFPAAKSPDTAPVVVWLQGGPGASSLFGLFGEHGPYEITENKTLALRKYSWTKTLSMLYIDNPVGTGYSFTSKDEGYTKCEEDVGVNLYSTIYQFFKMFPWLLKNEFYVTGESYGGKYGPALAYAIHEQNKVSDMKINLRGIALGNGFSDPVNMLNYGEYLYEIGLIDLNARTVFDHKRDQVKQLINDGKLEDAFEVFDSVMDSDLINCSSLFTNLTGFRNYYNYLYTSETDLDLTAEIAQQKDVRRRIHVGSMKFNVDKKCEMHLKADIMRSVAPWVQILLDNDYKFMVYNGQLDIIVAYPLTVEYLKNLKWKGAAEYKNASRHIWKVNTSDKEVAGYVKLVRNLIEVLVRNAGHMVPTDQPRAAYDLITRFVFEKAFV